MAVKPNLTTTDQFQLLQDLSNTAEDGVDIFLVPGIKTAPPESWPFADRKWLASLPRSGAGVRVLAYKYDSLHSDTKFSWGSILTQGHGFLQQLKKFKDAESQSDRDHNLTANRPIVIVCHSLGGVIVKQALCAAHEQPHEFRSTSDIIAGVIFLSTSHHLPDDGNTLTLFCDILEATTSKRPKISESRIEHERTILRNLAQRFEASWLHRAVLSVYELRKSKISSTPLLSKVRELVNYEACLTRLEAGKVVGLPLSHHDTCIFTKSASDEGLAKVNAFIYKFLQDAPRQVATRLDEQQYQNATMSPSSPTMSELPLKVEESGPTNVESIRATEETSPSESDFGEPEFEDTTDQRNGKLKPLHLPCHMLDKHPVNEYFCGREGILERISTELLPSKNAETASGPALKQFALCGFGGIGKTEIAREFARRHCAEFEAIFWVVADEAEEVDYQYRKISLKLGLQDISECNDEVVTREAVKNWLSNPQKRTPVSDVQPTSEVNWLLVFDCADDPMILADYWPQGRGSILITSRNPSAKSIFTGRPSGLDVGPLTQKASLSLLNRLTNILNEPEDAGRISRLLGGVPLAISQMAQIILQQKFTLSELKELYSDYEQRASLYEANIDSNLVTYTHNLSSVWQFDQMEPKARQLLELISFLDPDSIGEDFLANALMEATPETAQLNNFTYSDALADLLQSSLVQRDKDKGQISVHRLVQNVTLATMDVLKRQIQFDQVVRILWADWPSAMPKPSKEPELPEPKSTGGRLHVLRWPYCEAIYPHVLRTHQLWPSITGPSEATKLLFAKLLNEAAWYQKERGRLREFHCIFETARSICESSTHVDRDSSLADIYFCLAAVAMDVNDFNTSRVYKERSFNIVFKICKDQEISDERLSLAYAERGVSRIQDNRYEEGEADLKEAIRIRNALGDYIPRSAEANLGFALLAQGKIEECNKLLLESLAARENSLGKYDKESVRTGLILYALGNLRATQGRWRESDEYHRRASYHMRNTVGEKHCYAANVAHKVAEHFMRRGMGTWMLFSLDEALDVWSADPIAHKNEIARTTFLKGQILEEDGQVKRAFAARRVVSRLHKKITKEDRDVKSLTMKDFDEIVAFWAR